MAPVGYGPQAFFLWRIGVSSRVVGFIDGFNLYHSIDTTGQHHLKWVNLRSLCAQFAPSPQFNLEAVYYFSAFATWRADAYARHRVYVAAVESVGVTPIMGRFKNKPRQCRTCRTTWTDHEEKETDVNLALKIVEGALRDEYDLALILTGDSDIGPAVSFVRREFPSKAMRIITAMDRPFSSELVAAAGQPARKLRRVHVEHALFPETVADASGRVVARRPVKYAPPR